MDLLATYSSDSSNDEASGNINLQKEEESDVDFFNLHSGGDKETNCDKFLDSYNLVVQSSVLNPNDYGPSNQTNAFDDKVPQVPIQQELRHSIHQDHNEDDKICIYHAVKIKDSLEIESTPIYYNDDIISSNIGKKNECYVPKKETNRYSYHHSCVSSLSWCIPSYSNLLVSSSLDATVKVWDINKLTYVREFITDGGVKSAKWNFDGTRIVCGGFDKRCYVYDVATGSKLIHYTIGDYISSIVCHPGRQDLIIIGTNNKILCYDQRVPEKIVKGLYAKCHYVLDMAFLPSGDELVCSTDIVNYASPDKTIMMWDFDSGVIVSNEIYCERYVCPSLAVEPKGRFFMAQSHGNYMIMFSTQRPYKMVKKKRYSHHKVDGYPIGCDFSNDSELLASGSADGSLYIYSSEKPRLLRKINIGQVPLVKVAWHPILPSYIATGSWDGNISIWH